ncbi:MAG TPA: hypothetical protein DD640_03805 [Clostridiales bacterium]|nr:hypothetical protein [Clostridiales bacterium]
METELKLRFTHPDGPGRLLDDPWFHQLVMPDSSVDTDMFSRYFDTPDQILTSRQTLLRIRKEGDRNTVTVKLGVKADNGLHQRLEWTVELPDGDWPAEPETGLDINWFQKYAVSDGDPDDQLRMILEMIEGRPLVEICQARFIRKAYDVGFGSTLMELALDQGEISAGSLADAISELEVELKEGDVRDLIALGAELIRRYDLVPEPQSKYSRCLELLRQQGGLHGI